MGRAIARVEKRDTSRTQLEKVEAEMTREQMATLASRAFALLMAVWALVEVSSLPERIVSLTHHLAERGVLRTEDYWSTYYTVALASLIVRILALAIAAMWFWKAGPRPQRLFLGRG